MPRAMLELRAVLRAAGVRACRPIAVPTPALNARRWWRSPRAARLMVVEYCKYLAILGREAVLGLGPRDAGAGVRRQTRRRADRDSPSDPLLFVALFYLWSALVSVGCTPLLLGPRPLDARRCSASGAAASSCLLRRLRHPGRGARARAHAHGAAAGRAQAPVHARRLRPVRRAAAPRCFVMKKELTWIPWFGWYAAEGGQHRRRPRRPRRRR